MTEIADYTGHGFLTGQGLQPVPVLCKLTMVEEDEDSFTIIGRLYGDFDGFTEVFSESPFTLEYGADTQTVEVKITRDEANSLEVSSAPIAY